VISRQLDLFERDHADLIRESEQAEREYDRGGRDDAEEHYGNYQDVVETATEVLADLRDHFASSLGEEAAEQYEAEFNRGVAKRFRTFGFEIENR